MKFVTIAVCVACFIYSLSIQSTANSTTTASTNVTSTAQNSTATSQPNDLSFLMFSIIIGYICIGLLDCLP
nr:membrane protein m119.3 [Murid betaherpesvirus 8]WPH25290.1 membrane protein m119.3 [Murid betaherpesvirus 8]WPH25423.1 membrane protein m119.3 [Murid betaherpesvirus 8]